MHRKTTLGLALSLAMTLAFTAHARVDKDAEVKLDSTAPVAEQIAAIEKALSSEDYSEISMEQKSTVQQALGRIRLKMGDHQRVDEVSPQARVEIFNDQEKVNTILTQARADSRMVCRRERSTGSNMPQRVCMTVAQRREAEEAGRKALRDSPALNNYRP
ncbi:hypothetical protein C1924_15640 [Stenotrophomonas sp. ESTM1D_MKCIP4_1]|uniref:hypothetical protein n=1 Tax=Stenotrophomonas sp. ESTM1D_MKCIP4_1 TaxID=2072414 RepID=UPI000D540A5F|nr:hypothetical protein [Stenotrophomonas sp. ESTM1D_MKCIP4_1]AWH54509.1 hypothetical protein C1924_15640 [Stenotrophomonas sp. ESTM1D_MKCIP4_1]